jgi:hypothetical protein
MRGINVLYFIFFLKDKRRLFFSTFLCILVLVFSPARADAMSLSGIFDKFVSGVSNFVSTMITPSAGPGSTQAVSTTSSSAECGPVYAKDAQLPPGARRAYELRHKDCYKNVRTGLNAVISSLTAAVDSLFTQMQRIGFYMFFIFAPLSLVSLGIRVAFGLESGWFIPLGRAFIALLISYATISAGPILLNSIIQQSQMWGSTMSQSLHSSLGASIPANDPNGLFGSNASHTIGSGAALDPVGFLKMGLEDAGAIMFASIPVKPGTWIQNIEEIAVGGPRIIIGAISAITTIVAFTIIAAEAFIIIFDNQLYVMFAPIVFAFMAWNAGGGFGHKFDYHKKMVDIFIKQGAKVIVFYFVIAILYIFQAGILSLISGAIPNNT